MKIFIKSLDEKAWCAIMFGWKHPTTKDDSKIIILKLEDKWSSKKDKLASENSKTLYTIS